MTPTVIAALDVGTNSIRTIIARVDESGGYRILDDEKATVRLGEGMEESGRISDAAWARAKTALRRMAKIAEGLGVEAIDAVATSAVRDAANGQEFIDVMEAETGIAIRLIDGREEAELAALSAHSNFHMAGVRHAIIDIGGGSTEVVIALGDIIEEAHSFPFGAAKLTEKFLGTARPTPKQMKKTRAHVEKIAGPLLGTASHRVNLAIGSGGTMSAIANLVMSERNDRYDSTHGYEVLRADIAHVRTMLSRMGSKQRRSISGLSAERADIITAGVIAVETVMHLMGTNVLKINDKGIREGMLLRRIAMDGGAGTGFPNWREELRKLAAHCHCDMAHADQVVGLALTIFDHVSGGANLGLRDRKILEAAAILHDVGNFLDFEKHHKRSYHLIRHANLPGFSPREREIIANVARYHRGALPKRKHEGFSGLRPADRQIVEKLGGVLRLADGLDRRRGGQVETLAISEETGGLLLTLRGAEDLGVERHGGIKKADLFERAFAKEVRFRLDTPVAGG